MPDRTPSFEEKVAEYVYRREQTMVPNLEPQFGPPPDSEYVAESGLRERWEWKDPAVDEAAVRAAYRAKQIDSWGLIDALYPFRRKILERGGATKPERVKLAKQLSRKPTTVRDIGRDIPALPAPAEEGAY